MGTSSSGNTGGGSGTRAGSSIGAGVGGYVSSRGSIGSSGFDASSIGKEISDVFTRCFNQGSDYMKLAFGNSHLDCTYNELFKLSEILRGPNAEQAIADRYDIDLNEADFLIELRRAISNRCNTKRVDPRCEAATNHALEKFLDKAVDEEHTLIVRADGKKVIKKLQSNSSFWKSISGYFLAPLAISVYQAEIRTKSRIATFRVKSEIERRTNEVIEKYKAKSKGQANYRKLFGFISDNWQLFREEMTK